MTVEQVRPWIALGAGVVLLGVGIITVNATWVALGAGAIGLPGMAGAVRA